MAVGLLSACGSDPNETQAAPDAPPTPVAVTLVTAAPLTVTADYPGRVTALRVAEIRPQVSGIVQRRLFEQGAEVRAGQALFTINPAPFKADAAVAKAALQRAESTLVRAQLQVSRLDPLVKAEAVSQQSYDDAIAQRDQAAADVAQARATHERRQLDLTFATVSAPISGRVDQALQTEGALVSATDTAAMARIVQIDQVYVDVRQPAATLDALRLMMDAQRGTAAKTGLPVTVLGGKGEVISQKARVLFSGVSVDAGTGDVLLRAQVDNPKRQLLPGMFVQARVPVAHYPAALIVPQQAVARTAGGTQVWVLDTKQRATPVAVVLGEQVKQGYRIEKGLKAGDRIVVSGMERLAPGGVVAPSDWQAQSAAAASPVDAYPL